MQCTDGALGWISTCHTGSLDIPAAFVSRWPNKQLSEQHARRSSPS